MALSRSMFFAGAASFLIASLAGAQSATPVAEAKVKLGEEKGSAVLELDGKCPNLPDGTKLHVRLVVEKANVEGAFFMTPVTGERFRARKLFAKKTFAPLPYVVTVELILADQRQAIGRLIRQTWGLASDARVLLIKESVKIGTPEEEAAFRVSSITTLLELISAAQKTCVLVEKELGSPAPKDNKERRLQVYRISKYLRPNFVTPFDAFRRKHVVLQEQEKVSRLLDLGTSLGPLLRLHQEGETKKAKSRLDVIRQDLLRMTEELKSRLPKQEAPEKKQGESGQ